MAHAIASAGAEVVLIAPRAEPAAFERSHPALSRRFLLDVHAGRGLFSRLRRLVARTLRSLTALLQARRHSDLYLITFIGQIPAGLLHILWIRLLGGRIVYLVHDPSPHAWAFPAWFQGVERAMLKLQYRLSERLVTLTEVGRRELIRDYACRSEDIEVIPHGALTPPRTVPTPGNGQILLFGMLRRNKRILEAIEAFKAHHSRFPRLRLLIAGAPHREDPAYWQQCQASIGGSESRVQTEIGFIEESRLTELVETSDGILLAYEDFGSQSGAAVLSGLSERVVIGTRAGGLAELREMGLEMVDVDIPVTADTIADALERFAVLPVDELRSIAARSRAALEPKLAWDGIGRQYKRLFEDLVRYSSASSRN
jgi:glycosyltransferase involved in cell wall biosynthesis